MLKTLLSFSVLAGLAGGTAATPADAAPLAHGLLPPVEALLPAVNTATDAVPNEGASAQTVQFFRHYDRRSYHGHHFLYGRHAYYGRRSYGGY